MNSDNLIGNILSGRYDVMEKIGTGGMACVYKAKDTLLNRYVAVKVLREALEGEKNIVKNFIKEAQSSASLTHNNIVSVFDVGEDDDVNYMVMELVDGRTLKDYIKEKGELPWQEACDYCIQIGRGLSEAHSKNIIHRDIKPQNIIMTKDKTLKVPDFGIARALSSDTKIVGGTALGSVHYISPEQARGGFTDARSDIYSLGIVLYEMLTGRVPFDGETAVSVALMHLEKDPVNVKAVNMNVPQDLAYVTMKAIAKEQAKRYQTVAEMLDDLHAVLAEEPLVSNELMKAEDKIVTSVSDILKETDGYNDVDDEYEESSGLDYIEEDDFDDEDDFDIPNEEVVGRRVKKNNEKKSVDIYDEEKPKKIKKKKSPEQKKADRLATLLAILTVVIIVGIILGVYFILNARGEISIPSVENMTVSDARNKIESSGLSVDSAIEFSLSDDVENGKVIAQAPAAGKKLSRGSDVALIVSIGKSDGDITVPGVSKLTFEDAINKLSDKKLNYAVIEDYSDDVAVGKVIRQVPLKGTTVCENDVVTLYVSKGRLSQAPTPAPAAAKATVPSLNGETKESAEALLQEVGLTVGLVTMQYSKSMESFIIDQSPEKGKSVAKGSVVNIVLSRGHGGSGGYSSATGNSDSGERNSENEERKESTSSGKTKSFTVTIPDAVGDTVNVEIVVDGKSVHNEMHKKSEETVTVDLEGEGSSRVQAYIDGSKVADKTVEFD